MAIGTTALIFELKEFDYVNAVDYLSTSKNYKQETIKLSGNDTININFNEEDFDYYCDWTYDDSLKDEVKITLSNGVSYRIDGKTLNIYNIDYSYDNGFDGFWDRVDFMLEGLKKRKVYELDNSRIMITTSYANRDRVQINYGHN